MKSIKIGNKMVGDDQPVYIIAEVGSNFDGSLEQAKKLSELAKEAGADAVKFQSFRADKIVCKEAFDKMGNISFQVKWKKTVYDVYRDNELPREWHEEISNHCKKIGIDFLSSPYDVEAVDLLDKINVPAFKIGSGEIDNPAFLEYIAKKGKPIILSTGASNLKEIEEAVDIIRSAGNENLVLLQCITNYPSPIEDANIRAMITLRKKFDVLVGYSDHMLGHLVPLGAVASGACVIEKHFTYDKTKEGPDHPHAMNPEEFASMIRDIRSMEKALGSYEKKVELSEKETVILQRRCIHANVDIPKGKKITKYMLTILRPAPPEGIKPKFLNDIVGKTAKKDIEKGDAITKGSIE